MARTVLLLAAFAAAWTIVTGRKECAVIKMDPFVYQQHKAPDPTSRGIQEAMKRNRHKEIDTFDADYTGNDIMFPSVRRHQVMVNVTFKDRTADCFVVEYEIANLPWLYRGENRIDQTTKWD